MQRRPPEVIRQHHGSGGILSVVGRSQQASKHGAQAHHLKVVPVHNARWNLAWRTQTHDREIHL